MSIATKTAGVTSVNPFNANEDFDGVVRCRWANDIFSDILPELPETVAFKPEKEIVSRRLHGSDVQECRELMEVGFTMEGFDFI